MNKAYILTFSVGLLCAGTILGGCGEPTGGSGSSEVLRNEPIILESVLALSVSDDRPDGITDVIVSDLDDRVYLWMFWTDVKGRHTAQVRWFSPDASRDDPLLKEDRVFSSASGEHITWFFIDRPLGGFEKGEWSVEIRLDGLFERSHLFLVQ